MKHFFVSDLHLGDRGRRDNFYRNEKAFLEFLSYVDSKSGTLYLLGDVFEWWQCHPLRVVDAYWSLIYGLEQRANLYITGNHDNLFSPVIGVTRVIPRPDWPLTRKSTTGPLVIRGSNTTYLLLMHGHEVDEYCNSANPGVGHITAVLCGLAEDRLEKDGAEQSGGDIEARVMRILEAGAGLRNKLFNGPDRVAALEEGIEQYRVSANRQPAPPHYCIFGHTHHPGVFANGHNFNCGSWVYPMRTYVVYDSETGACGCQTWGGT